MGCSNSSVSQLSHPTTEPAVISANFQPSPVIDSHEQKPIQVNRRDLRQATLFTETLQINSLTEKKSRTLTIVKSELHSQSLGKDLNEKPQSRRPSGSGDGDQNMVLRSLRSKKTDLLTEAKQTSRHRLKSLHTSRPSLYVDAHLESRNPSRSKLPSLFTTDQVFKRRTKTAQTVLVRQLLAGELNELQIDSLASNSAKQDPAQTAMVLDLPQLSPCSIRNGKANKICSPGVASKSISKFKYKPSKKAEMGLESPKLMSAVKQKRKQQLIHASLSSMNLDGMLGKDKYLSCALPDLLSTDTQREFLMGRMRRGSRQKSKGSFNLNPVVAKPTIHLLELFSPGKQESEVLEEDVGSARELPGQEQGSVNLESPQSQRRQLPASADKVPLLVMSHRNVPSSDNPLELVRVKKSRTIRNLLQSSTDRHLSKSPERTLCERQSRPTTQQEVDSRQNLEHSFGDNKLQQDMLPKKRVMSKRAKSVVPRLVA